MGYSPESLARIADAMVEETVKMYVSGENKMAFMVMLMGSRSFKLEAFPGAGHNYYAILEAIYRYHKAHPEAGIDQIFYDRLSRYCELAGDPESASDQVNYIAAQLENEKKHTAPFTLDARSLLQKFRPAFEDLYEDDFWEREGIPLEKQKKENEQWLEETARFMKENYDLEF